MRKLVLAAVNHMIDILFALLSCCLKVTLALLLQPQYTYILWSHDKSDH